MRDHNWKNNKEYIGRCHLDITIIYFVIPVVFLSVYCIGYLTHGELPVGEVAPAGGYNGHYIPPHQIRYSILKKYYLYSFSYLLLIKIDHYLELYHIELLNNCLFTNVHFSSFNKCLFLLFRQKSLM